MKMTNEEAISIIDDLADWFDDPTGHTDNDTRRSKAIRTAIEAMEKSEKHKWHDLRKNPDDLPEGIEFLAIKENNEHIAKVIRGCINISGKLYDIDDTQDPFSNEFELDELTGKPIMCESNGCKFLANRIIAWKCIEPFEEEYDEKN